VEEFDSLHHTDVHLRDVWPRTAIIQKAEAAAATNGDIGHLMDSLTDPWDEGKPQLLLIFHVNIVNN